MSKTTKQKPPPLVHVYGVGSQVDLGSNLVGTVLEVLIKQSGIQYRVVWWDSTSRKVEWLESFEVTALESERMTKVGFYNGAK